MDVPLNCVISCPICLKTMKKPILQCQTGHSMCGDCILDNNTKQCPQCHKGITSVRNFQLEQIIDGMSKNLRTVCKYVDDGCRELITANNKYHHENECKKRRFLCEGRTFAGWKCPWTGKYSDLEEHFNSLHDNNNGEFAYKTNTNLKISLKHNYYDVKIISFFEGQELFWYKHKIDKDLRKVFWTFQYIGSSEEAKNFFYEFEINTGPIRKFKVTEICDNDVVDANQIFQEERCVVIGFEAIKSFRNSDKELAIKFRIMKFKKRSENSK